jgi:hypothetical protein
MPPPWANFLFAQGLSRQAAIPKLLEPLGQVTPPLRPDECSQVGRGLARGSFRPNFSCSSPGRVAPRRGGPGDSWPSVDGEDLDAAEGPKRGGWLLGRSRIISAAAGIAGLQGLAGRIRCRG